MVHQHETRWEVVDDATAIAAKTVDYLLEFAEAAIRQNSVFKLVLAGGSTPTLTYQLLAKQNMDFSRWRLFLGDERCLPADHVERNSRTVEKTLIEPGIFTPDQFYVIEAESGAETGAKAYAETIRAFIPFDAVLLGLGEDGHTASLFPGHTHAADQTVLPVHNAPKPPPDRISLSASTLSTAQNIVFLVSGAGKYTPVQRWKAGENIPAAGVSGKESTIVLLDKAATQAPG